MSRRKTKPTLGVILLAGGRSKRFRSEVPKVLHPAMGRPVVGHVLETLRALHRSVKLGWVALVVPPGGEVEEALEYLDVPFDLRFAPQDPPLGTGDAARVGLEALPKQATDVLVLAGDAPLVHPESLKDLVRRRRKANAAVSILTAELDDPGSFGRILREGDAITGVVEVKDATAAQRRIREVNTCTYAFSRDALGWALPRLSDDNAQGEYYLTDVIAEIVGDGRGVVGVRGDADEVLGTNTRSEFAEILRVLRERKLAEMMDAGVTVLDPSSTYVDVDVRVGRDTRLLPNTVLESGTRIGAGCEIGPGVRLVGTSVGDGARVTFAVAKDSRIGPDAEVGPYASLRSGTVLGRGAKAGTFVEMKAAEVGEDAKVPHLSYMGDVRVGRGTNVGAGTITCNYNPFELAPDGSTKHRTWIGDDVYISSDTMLVAPVRLGHGSQTGAGSVVTRNVGDGRLAYGAPATDRGPAKERVQKPAQSTARGKRSRRGATRKDKTSRSRKDP